MQVNLKPQTAILFYFIFRLKSGISLYMTMQLVFIAVLFISGCAPSIDYRRISGMLAAKDCSGAKQIASQDNYGSNNRLLYLMDSGIINMQCGDAAKASDFFNKASYLGDELWTESISANALSMITNDYALPYSGEDFERVMLPLFSGLCYMKLDRYDEALVDFRKLDIILDDLNSRYESKNIYKEDALARYLGAALYETAGKNSDAFIDYYRAFSIYRDYQRDYGLKIPDFAAQDLIASGRKTGRLDEVVKLMGEDYFRSVKTIDTKGKGRVIFINFAGSAPEKHDEKIILPSYVGPITIAFPVMRPVSGHCRPSGLVIKNPEKTYTARFEVAENINAIAMKNLEDRRARYIAKALARATAKQVIIHQIGTQSTRHDNTRDLIKIFMNILNVALEQADTRSWRTLPGEILISRFYIPEGEYTVKSEGCNKLSDYERKMSVRSGTTTFIVNEASLNGY